MPGAIITRGLSRHFGRLTAVDNLDLDIQQASIYGFLGPNGSGKSTTIRMLCGLLTPSEGSIEVLGYDIPRQAEALRKKIGYMTQKFSLFEDLTVAENLDFIGDIYALPKARKKQRIEFLLKEYNLAQRRKQMVGTMSGGQKQRLALAAATLHEPELLFLDEPTSAVDPQSRRDFWENLFDLSAAGTTILVSTHYMDEAERCHGLAILDQGRKVAAGQPQRLMDDLDATVIEVSADAPREIRNRLLAEDGVKGVAQIGAKLRVLVDKPVNEPATLVRKAVAGGHAGVEVRKIDANLEDVFVAATSDEHLRALNAAGQTRDESMTLGGSDG